MHRRRFIGLAAGLPFAAACSGGGSDARTQAPSTAAAPAEPTSEPSRAPTATATSTARASSATPARQPEVQEYPVVAGSGPHDVAPEPGGGVWYTGQRNGTLGLLDPATGTVTEVRLGTGSAPHGVIVGPDGAAWVTDGGQDAIVRIDGASHEVRAFPLPGRPGANLNTAVFDGGGKLWFTGQNGYHGRVDPATGVVDLYSSPRGRGPYGITATPSGDIYYASLAGSHIARVDLETGQATPIEPPTAGSGPRRVWSDSKGVIWASEWNAGQVSSYTPRTGEWRSWKLPGARPQCYSVYVDDNDLIWLTDFGANAILRFNPRNETFEPFPLSRPNANVRQMLGRPGEAWGAESGLDALVVVRT